MQPFTLKTLFREGQEYVLITLGLLMYAVGFNCFQLPYQITSGGVAGAGAIIYYATGFPASYTYFIVNIFLLVAAVKVLGWRFCIKTIYSVLVLTLFLELVRDFCMSYGLQHASQYALSPNGLPQFVKDDAFMSTILGAALEGVGLGIIFLNNGSTGGTDIIAAIVNKYKDITLGQMMMFTDLLIITSSMLLPGSSISRLLYGYCTLLVANILLDFVVDRGRQSVQFLIFSERYDAIADAITRTGRGVTVLNGEGWYTHATRQVLVVLAKKRESNNIFRIIQSTDPNAFISQSKVVGVYGYGFDPIKVKAKNKKGEGAEP